MLQFVQKKNIWISNFSFPIAQQFTAWLKAESNLTDFAPFSSFSGTQCGLNNSISLIFSIITVESLACNCIDTALMENAVEELEPHDGEDDDEEHDEQHDVEEGDHRHDDRIDDNL